MRFRVVGGVAVVLHGHPRFTADLDLVLDLDVANVTRALDVLAAKGFRPRPPVPIADFADPEKRRSWIDEKGLMVFSRWRPAAPGSASSVQSVPRPRRRSVSHRASRRAD